LRLIGYIFSVLTIISLSISAVLYAGYLNILASLPDYKSLDDYMPAVKSSVYAANGSLISDFASVPRVFLPIDDVPDRVKAAFISAEDKNFYQHSGIDFQGMARAVFVNLKNLGQRHSLAGASTITQQVAKNIFLSPEQTLTRKITEAVLAMKMDREFSKDHILELYLNQIFFGMNSYGIAQAAMTYFHKSVGELTVAEAAYLASLPKGPANYQPFRHPEAALERRNWVIDRMVENGYVDATDAVNEKKKPLGVTAQAAETAPQSDGYFIDEVRQRAVAQFGEKSLLSEGLSIRTTLDPGLQIAAGNALRRELVTFDQGKGYRGPIGKLDISGDWKPLLQKFQFPIDVPGWDIAVVLSSDPTGVDIGLRSGGDQDRINAKQLGWALRNNSRGRTASARELLAPGDIILVEHGASGYELRQVPRVQGALVAMEPATGRVVAMVGGFSHARSQFNRATQALRQPGSTFKPIVYASALDSGFTPSTVLVDEPTEFKVGTQIWKPKNDEDEYGGPETLRYGLEHSKNVMAAKLAEVVGMPTVAEYAQRFGIYDHPTPVLSMSIGASETSLLKMVSAYAIIANGGMGITPALIDRVQDRTGKTIYKQDQRHCAECNSASWTKQDEPAIEDVNERVLDPMTAYQVTSMMEGVVTDGTAKGVITLGRPLAGKTGTTNDNHDAWFIGFTPQLVTGVYIGYDQPESLGHVATGRGAAAPVFNDFMKVALANQPPADFVMPAGMQTYSIQLANGMIASGNGPGTAIEAFKPGTQPATSLVIVGEQQQPAQDSQQLKRAEDSGAAGLF